MDKILVEIACPATSKHYDFWISKEMKICAVKQKVMLEIREFEKNDSIFFDEDNIRFYCENEKVLQDENQTIERAGIKSGDCLMLI